MTNYSLSKKAEEDLRNIYKYGLLNFGEHQADRYYFGLIQQLETIAASPLLFPAAIEIHPEARKCVYGVNTIYYKNTSKHVHIMTIIRRQNIHDWI